MTFTTGVDREATCTITLCLPLASLYRRRQRSIALRGHSVLSCGWNAWANCRPQVLAGPHAERSRIDGDAFELRPKGSLGDSGT